MYLINTTTNRIEALPTKYFSDLGFTERKHLQEWLAYESNALGEELLIIQKEFDGFDETRERLDLLALDKAGNLVIIENKLDDSGRDVVWQALKYASYCSSLSKLQIIEIYQQYLNRYQNNDDAVSQICEFLEIPDIEEIKLNTGNSQRLILVAAYFRKEVTSTVLWLLGQGLSIQCFKVTPYQLQNQLLLNIEQIIPTPEEKEFRIGMSVKEAEEKTADVMLKNRHSLENKKASRVQMTYAIDSYNHENWEECINWLIDNLQRLEKAMSRYLQSAARQLKQIPLQSDYIQAIDA